MLPYPAYDCPARDMALGLGMSHEDQLKLLNTYTVMDNGLRVLTLDGVARLMGGSYPPRDPATAAAYWRAAKQRFTTRLHDCHAWFMVCTEELKVPAELIQAKLPRRAPHDDLFKEEVEYLGLAVTNHKPMPAAVLARFHQLTKGQ